MQNGSIRSWTPDDCLFKLLQQYFVHKFLTKSMETIKSVTKKEKHNSKQIKYRRKLNLVLLYLYEGELTA